MRVVATAGLNGQSSERTVVDGNIDLTLIERLRNAMCGASRPVKANKVGEIGEAFLTKRLIELDGVVPETARYVNLALNDALRPLMFRSDRYRPGCNTTNWLTLTTQLV